MPSDTKRVPRAKKADIAVIGAGIVGIAHALEAARRGLSVVLFERNTYALGASIRNFGIVFPLGMSPGTIHERALRSRAVWLKVAAQAGIWHKPTGALIVAYHEDECAVLNEFAGQAAKLGYRCAWLEPDEVVRRSPALRINGLRGGLWSPEEVIVDPREAIAKLPDYLRRTYNVGLCFGKTVTGIAMPYIEAGGETWCVERAIVCSGTDFETLYPAAFAASGLTRCKLQMMRTVPQPGAWRLGPMLATGLSLRHYPAFSLCPSLPALKRRIAQDHPALERWGIHVLVAQNGLGELLLGDSHEYGWTSDPFDRPEIDALILAYIETIFTPPSLAILQRWHGVYARHPTRDVFFAEPEPNVRIVNGLGGTGMTTSFGLAQDVLTNWEGARNLALIQGDSIATSASIHPSLPDR